MRRLTTREVLLAAGTVLIPSIALAAFSAAAQTAGTVTLDEIVVDGNRAAAGTSSGRAANPNGPESAYGPVKGYIATRSATATKTDTPIRDIPQSISVVTAQQARDQGALSIQEALRYTPGVYADAFGNDTRGDYPRIRGSDPDIYLDGLRLADTFQFNEPRPDPYTLSRYEVLRGPSSMLYGASTTAGLVNLVSKRPMGHVDHGKTSLLDALREANVVSGEAGGITQHIGAYQITTPDGHAVTFIDTPGHAAFTSMRARGAKVTDIVVLVVAADDGVMPQTKEAIAHAKAAGVPIIVAINKMDKPEAKPERVRGELAQHDIQVETFGGDVLEVEVSALKRTNLDKLLEVIALQAEILDLKANPDRSAEGTVIESRLDRGRGPVATVLVQRGTLKVGDLVVGGTQWGKVRALIDDKGENVQSAGPSMPVEILGFSGSPEAGDRVGVVESESRAREITDYRDRQKRELAAARVGGARSSLVDMMSQLKTATRKEVPIVIKGDVQGSVEAIVASLEDLNTDEVAVRVLQAGVGGITESDVTLAEASNAVIIGFNVRALKEARGHAEQAGIEIRYYNVIYNLIDDIKAAMSGLLDPTLREDMLGNALILEVFHISKVGKVAGCRITDGRVERGAHVRLIRDNVVVHEGKLSTLKRFKDEVKEVNAGTECGMAFENYQDMRQGDVIECYTVQEIKRSL